MHGIPGVVSAAALRAGGMSRSALRHAIAVGRLVRVRRGVYCDGARWRASARSPVDRHAIEVCAVWMSVGRRGWATGYSAALVQDLPVPHGQPEVVTFTLPQRTHGRRIHDGVRFRTAAVRERDVVVVRGVPVSGPARTVVEVAREHGFSAGLVVADAAVRAGLVGAGQLREAVGQVSSWPGGRAAGCVAEHANGAREAPTESLSFAAFVQHGLVLPESNAWVVGQGLGGIRADFVWREHRLVGEVDGRVKYTDPMRRAPEKVLVDEKNRQLRIEEAGFVVVRWTGTEATYRPQDVIERIIRHSAVAAEIHAVPPLADPRGLA